jgi:hypothetical protein
MSALIRSIIMIIALVGAIGAVMIADAGLVTSLLIGAGVAGVIAARGLAAYGTPSDSRLEHDEEWLEHDEVGPPGHRLP